MASINLTEYERKRLENIRRNDQMVAALKLHSKATELSASSKRQRVGAKSFKVSAEKKPKPQPPTVIRRSLRTRGMPPDMKALEDDPVESTPKAHKPLSSQSNPSPRKLGPISFMDASRQSGSQSTLIYSILSISKKSRLIESIPIEPDRPGGCNGEERGGCFVSSAVREAKKVEKSVKLDSLTLYPENIARVVPGRIMVVRLFPCAHSKMVVVGNKFGEVGFWNADFKGEEGNGLYLYRPHPGPLSGISMSQHDLSKVYTSCYDGFIRSMDAEKEVFDLVYCVDDTIYSLSQQPNDVKCLYFSEGRGGLNIFDHRTGNCTNQLFLHEDRINSIDFSPENPNVMATSSTDGTARIWDLRHIGADKPKMLKMISHKRAVHSAYFSPSGSFLATTSYDDSVGISSGDNFEDVSMVQHYNQTGRWISSFRAIWGWDDSHIFIGNMKRGVDVISSSQRKIIYTLQSPHISAIPCRFDVHPNLAGVLAGGTSGGQVYLWTPS